MAHPAEQTPANDGVMLTEGRQTARKAPAYLGTNRHCLCPNWGHWCHQFTQAGHAPMQPHWFLGAVDGKHGTEGYPHGTCYSIGCPHVTQHPMWCPGAGRAHALVLSRVQRVAALEWVARRVGTQGRWERAGGATPPLTSTPHPADPAPVLEAARSLEDRLQQLQRLEPEPSPLKELGRPWKKHPELVSSKGTPRYRPPCWTRVAVTIPSWVPRCASEHPWDVVGLGARTCPLAYGPWWPWLLSPAWLCPPAEHREGTSPAAGLAAEPLRSSIDSKALCAETSLQRNEAEKQKYVSTGDILGCWGHTRLCPPSWTRLSVCPSLCSFLLHLLCCLGWDRCIQPVNLIHSLSYLSVCLSVHP